MVQLNHQNQIAEQVFAGNSEMARLMRSHDWSPTLLGSVSDWSLSLKTAVNICLNSRFPMVIWWGEELMLLYNDAWQAILGNRHPKALSRPGKAVFPESWYIIGPQLKSVLETGIATWAEDLLIPVLRSGYLEEAYYTYSYSPIFTEMGKVEGVFTAVAETTHRVLSERRLATLKDLAAQSSKAKTVDEVYQSTLKTLSNNSSDIPFAALYRLHSDLTQAALCGQTPADLGAILMPTTINLSETDPWSFAAVLQTQTGITIEDLAHQWGEVPVGVLSLPINQALALPIRASGQDAIVGLLVVGVNPACSLDSDYRAFFDLMAGHIETAIANVSAYEAERKRVEALVEIDRAKTAFFSNVSHEFRTPLTLMLSPLEELSNTLDARLQTAEREQLQMLQRNGLRLLKLVNALLDFSRIEAGRVQASYEPTDLATYTAELASVFRSLIERAGLNLVIECPPLPQPVYVDREMWEKIVLNLMSNAFKFTFDGTITIRLQPVGNVVELSLTDTGVGIPEAELPRLFERFHRISGMRSRTYEGSGIGLALVQELVKLHGGTIRVLSQVDHGTSFVIALPFGSAHLPADRIEAPRTLASTASGANSYVEEAARWISAGAIAGSESLDSDPAIAVFPRSKDSSLPLPRILLADDNADMRDYVQRLLSPQYEVEAVSDGVAALAAVRQQHPDLVLTDIMMPELDGFGLLQELRADPQTQALPIILVSARAGEESRIEGLEAGADDYLIKPFSARELLARVEATLKLAQLRQEATRREEAQRQAAEAAKAQLESVLASVNDQFIVLDREWRYSYVNDRVVETLGMPKEALLGRSIWEVFPEWVGGEFEWQIRRAAAEQIPVNFECFYPPWNRWFENRAYPSSEGLSIFVTEITDRKQAEEELRSNRERLAFVLKTTGIGLWLNPLPLEELNWDDQTRELFSVSPDLEPTFELFWSRIHPEDREPTRLAVEKALQEQTLYEIDHRAVNPDTGEIRWIRSAGQATYAPDGTPIRFDGISYDISDRKQAEEALRESLAILNTINQATPTQIYVKDRQGRLIMANPALIRVLGKPESEIIGYTDAEFYLNPDEAEPIMATDRQVMETGQMQVLEEVVQLLEGRRTFLSTKSPYSDERGIITGLIGVSFDITERKQAEALLRAAHDTFRHLVDNSPFGVYVVDADFCLAQVSVGAQKVFENVRPLIGRDFAEVLRVIWLEPFASEVIALFQHTLETGEPYHAPNTVERRYDVGEIESYDWKIERITLPDGRFGVVCHFYDLSERQRYEAALRESEDRFRNMADNAPMLVWVTDATGYCTYLSRSWYDFTGQTETSGLECCRLDAIHSDDLEASEAIFLAANDHQEAFQLEYRLRHRNGHYRTCIDAAKPWFDGNGEFRGYIGSVIDITDRKQAQVALQLSEERLRLATEAADLGMWFWNLEADQLVWTTYCKELFGLDPDTEMSYERFLEALYPDDRDRTDAAVQQAITQKQEYDIEYRSLWNDGSIHWILAKGRAFYNEQGDPIHMMGIAQDITNRKQTEIDLQTQAHELSQMNQLLMQATALVNQRNQELDQFTHIVSHDLKAPLRAISNLSLWIEEDLADQVPPDTKQNLELLRSRVFRMETLINGLLAYAHISYQDAPDEPFDLNELLLEIVDSLAIPPEFTVEIPPNLPTIMTNRLLLSQVFTNLISNAVKYHDRADGQIQITAQAQAQGYEFAVADDGPGIDPENHSRVFEIFQTLNSQKNKESTGIGLAIIKKIVKHRGGHIDLDSELGQGATFSFTWPLSQ